MEYVTMALGLLGQFNSLIENEKVKPVIKDLSNWIKGLFAKNHNEGKITKLENDPLDKKLIQELKTEMKEIIDSQIDNRNQLIEKIAAINKIVRKDKKLKDEVEKGIKNITGESIKIIKIKGNKNVALMDVKNVKGGINIDIQ